MDDTENTPNTSSTTNKKTSNSSTRKVLFSADSRVLNSAQNVSSPSPTLASVSYKPAATPTSVLKQKTPLKSSLAPANRAISIEDLRIPPRLETPLPAAKSSATTQKTPKKSTPNAPRKSTTPKGIVNVPSGQCLKCLDKTRQSTMFGVRLH